MAKRSAKSESWWQTTGGGSLRCVANEAGNADAVQQKLMRHADIRTTMNIYGSVVTDEMEVASAKVAGLALRMTN